MAGDPVGTPQNLGLDLVFIRPGGFGWGPVSELVGLAGRLLQAHVIEVPDAGRAATLQRVATLLPRGPRRRGRRLLVVAGNPSMAAQAAHRRLWFPGYESTAAWIIDSFWTSQIPQLLRHRPHFDHLFVMDPDLVDEWRHTTGRPVSCLPWGADTLDRPDAGGKSVDVQRLGRQPQAWDDDARTAAAAAAAGLRFRGAPPAFDDAAANQAAVRTALTQAKIILAFSNLVSPAAYTHPTRDYVTARWTDGLAAGCLIAGAAPKAAAQILWPGATLEISPTDPASAWPVLQKAAQAWTPVEARRHQRLARQRLDWRHRLRALCETMGWPVPDPLADELRRLARIDTPPQ